MTTESLIEKYKKVRDYTEKLCTPLKIEDYIPQSVVFISPPKWHLGHTTWFFEQFILAQYCMDYKEFNKDFNFLFNSYYNTVGQRVARNERGLITRPAVEDVYTYRKYVNEYMLKYLNKNDVSGGVLNMVDLGLNHEQQHQELMITDLKYNFHFNPLFPSFDPENKYESVQNNESGFLSVAEGIFEIGHQGEGFCYDNELSRHKVYLHDFEINKALVTNGEYLEFIGSGAYKQFQWWHDEAWYWINQHKIESPLYWKRVDDQWFQFTLSGLKPIEKNAVLCHVNYYEAAAFAAWKGMRLPTEFEWEIASDGFEWGKRWEWTNSAYLPYPGYKKAEGAVGEYNGKFMLSQMVLRGSSMATSNGHSRKTYRNFFHPYMGWQFSGIRLAR